MDANYDEFGNYIGPDELSDNEWESDQSNYDSEDEKFEHAMDQDDDEESKEQSNDQPINQSAVSFPIHSAVYGPDTEIVIGLSDNQSINQPIIAPVKQTVSSVSLKELPECSFDWSFMFDLQSVPSKIRNVAIVGGFQHGKTSLIDRLVKATHVSLQSNNQAISRWTDHRHDEIARGLSIKSTPLSLVMTSSSHVSHLIRLIDCPGHVDFFDECLIGMRAADACIIVIDCCEGVTYSITQLISQAIIQGLRLMIVISKIDRLIVELKLPPADAYAKLVYIIDEINDIARSKNYDQSTHQSIYQPLCPTRGNVCFSSTVGDYIFSLQSIAQSYVNKQSNTQATTLTAKQLAKESINQLHNQSSQQSNNKSVNVQTFARQLWGDKYFHSDRKFRSVKQSINHPNSFIQFVLNPLYKIYAHTLGADTFDHFNQFNQAVKQSVNPSLQQSANPSINQSAKQSKNQSKTKFDMNPKQLLPSVFANLFGLGVDGLIDMIVDNCPSPIHAASTKISAIYTGLDQSQNQSTDQPINHSMNQSDAQTTRQSALVQSMLTCDPAGPLMADIIKLYHRDDTSADNQSDSQSNTKFDCLIRVYSGTLNVNDQVRILGPRYSLNDQEDQSTNQVNKIWIYQGRYRVEIPNVSAGNWALIDCSIDSRMKTATLCSVNQNDAQIFRTLDQSINQLINPSIKLAIEPLNPSELPSLMSGLRAVNQSYVASWTHVEESGEHVIVGPGELYLDCLMHDLRKIFAKIEIKVSEPSVRFAESISQSSNQPAIQMTANQANEFVFIAEPLESGIVQDMIDGLIKFDTEKSINQSIQRLEQVYGWDELASRSVLSIGPSEHPTNMLFDSTLKSETDPTLLAQCVDSLISGFQWATREGPLCDEPIRGVKFSLIRASFSNRPSSRSRGQLIPAARQACLQSFLLSAPVLLEPVYLVVITAPADCLSALTSILTRRRGYLKATQPIVGTPLFEVRAELPILESVGFQVDVRTMTQGQAFALCSFLHFAPVPGDPLDSSIVLRPLEPAPTPHLARDCMVKTRRRKGLSADVVRI